jgi:hypothetical protein
MKKPKLAIPKDGTASVPTAEVQSSPPQGQSVATRDHDIILAWAARHGAEPATGESTTSGPATAVNVNDGGVGIRFNFPGYGRFRPIAWEEWFEHFDRNSLVFVYEEDVADRAYALWKRRGGGDGSDRQDWFEAENQLRNASARPGTRYRFVRHTADQQDE